MIPTGTCCSKGGLSINPRLDCANLAGGSAERSLRGGDSNNPNGNYLRVTARDADSPTSATGYVGFRCARDR